LRPESTALLSSRDLEKHSPIAIVGAGCRFPGGVTNLDTFHRLLQDGVDAIREIPSERWSTSAFASEAIGVPGKTYSRWGGFLNAIDRFEPEAFGISAREAAVMDPQQRLVLEVVWEALEDAGIPLRDLAGTRTGVFVGISTFDYSQLQSSPWSKGSLQSLTALGTSLGIAANRVSYCLDVRGPSFVVDTACSSALVALDRAARSLQAGECDTAIVGGVNALLLPEVFISFSAASMLSPDGRCKAFDASANGFVRPSCFGNARWPRRKVTAFTPSF
jgi:acyl transferase domain-containing protein